MTQLKSILFLILLFWVSSHKAFSQRDYATTIAINNEFSETSSIVYSLGAEIEQVQFFYFNYALSHNFYTSHSSLLHQNNTKLFAGLGISNILKSQLGYSFAYKKPLLRFKLDLAYPLFKSINLIDLQTSDGIYPSLGFYAENMLDSELIKWSYGVNFILIFNFGDEN